MTTRSARRFWVGLGLMGGLACESSTTTTAAQPDNSVVINEVASTDGDRIELFNRSDHALDLYGWTVMDSSRDPNKAYAFPDGTYMAPGQYVVLYKGDHHSFGLGSKDGVYLLDPAGRVADSTSWGKNDALTSWCRTPNIAGPFRSCARATFGQKNPSSATGTTGGLIAPAQVLSRSSALPLEAPVELGYDGKGRLWVGLPKQHEIAVVDASGAVVGTAGGAGVGQGQFLDDGGGSGPYAIRAGAERAYATDRSGARVNIYDVNTLAPLGALTHESCADPGGLALQADGAVWVSDLATSTLTRFTTAGEADRHVPPLADTLTDSNGVSCRVPCGAETLALDETRGRLFVTSSMAGRIEVVDLGTGQYTGQTLLARQQGDTPEPGRVFDEVEGIAVDAQRDLLFAVDEHNARVLVFDLASPNLFDAAADFAFLGAFGGVGPQAGQLRGGHGLDFNPTTGLLALADQENDRIQIFSVDTIATSLGR